ncbi:DUF6221 family protein [Streptomyces sp. H10-C2]|uniref:DUF6221 family protein n=1 Tax=unclassified Streptomyces TaxID=2593676 RepID=UPI0024B97D64|nr:MULTISPECIES: DUF6221 family protein [unclassified Streptomyces]MDJ0342264.1 DUF6221 family protein [Streptomyces sp. PH10-H1]MDJ0368778.1 DUF6221 family protein [Streptomyces sp. H10-C2]
MTAAMLAFTHAAMDAAQRIAEAASGNEWLVAADNDGSGNAWVMNEDMHLLETEEPTARHIARHDPAAVLRRIAADRRLLELHADDYGFCAVCARATEETNSLGHAFHDSLPYPCTTARLIAEGYGWTEEMP